MMSPAALREGTERSAYLDFVKGIAIVLVELGHCIQYGSGQAVINTVSFFEDKLFRLIYSFHMPLFVLVSGYVFSGACPGGRREKLLGGRYAGC